MNDKVTLQDGTKIAYSLTGQGNPIVLLHCWTGNHKFWSNQIEYLSQDHMVFAPDYRGHGDSDVPDESFTVEKLAEDIYEVIKELNMSPAVIIGHSMGGMIAQYLCLEHSEDVSAMILIATLSSGMTTTTRNIISAQIMRDTPRLGYKNAFSTHFDDWFKAMSDTTHLSWIKEQMLKTPEKVALDLVGGFLKFNLKEQLHRVNVPTLVISGESDISTTPAVCGEIADRIKDSKLVLIPGAGHFPLIENPQAVNQAIDEFVQKHGF
jgi:3-oxoadipate enol-lactonase